MEDSPQILPHLYANADDERDRQHVSELVERDEVRAREAAAREHIVRLESKLDALIASQLAPVQPASAGANATSVSPEQPTAQSEPNFVLFEDHHSLKFKSETYILTNNQAKIIEILYEAYKTGMPAVWKGRLLAAIEAEESRVRDSFKGSPLWGTLIVTGGFRGNGGRRGTYWLNLE